MSPYWSFACLTHPAPPLFGQRHLGVPSGPSKAPTRNTTMSKLHEQTGVESALDASGFRASSAAFHSPTAGLSTCSTALCFRANPCQVSENLRSQALNPQPRTSLRRQASELAPRHQNSPRIVSQDAVLLPHARGGADFGVSRLIPRRLRFRAPVAVRSQQARSSDSRSVSRTKTKCCTATSSSAALFRQECSAGCHRLVSAGSHACFDVFWIRACRSCRHAQSIACYCSIASLSFGFACFGLDRLPIFYHLSLFARCLVRTLLRLIDRSLLLKR